MRLICPNCGAQYAVDSRVIPETGRDVQCSNCGNTWFQVHPDHDPDRAAEIAHAVTGRDRPVSRPPAAFDGEDSRPEPDAREADAAVTDSAPPSRPVPDAAMEATSTPEDAAASRPARGSWSEAAPAPEEQEEEDDEEDDDDFRTLPPRRSVHESAMSILREEAAREQAVRHRETGGLETQGELDIPPPARSVRDPARVIPSDTLPPSVARAERSSPRRDRLPDVEEINSSLDPADTMSAQAGRRTTEAEARSRGQRLGFGLALILFGTAAVVYVQAGRLAHALPDAAPVLERYVVTVDSGRLWLDRTLRDAVTPGGNSSQ